MVVVMVVAVRRRRGDVVGWVEVGVHDLVCSAVVAW